MRRANWVSWARSGGKGAAVFLFPYAGAGASAYRGWAKALPHEVDLALVQLPGREARIAEAPHRSLASLLDPLVEGILPHLARPFAFFGHSMGALLAFETARRLQAQGMPEPDRLVVSGYRAPHHPSPRPPLHGLPQDALVRELEKLGGTPPEFFEHPELLDLVLPVLRADLELCETYVHEPGPRLRCAVTAYGGLEDPDVPMDTLGAWREVTQGPFATRRFPGGHFFIHEASDQVLRALGDDVVRAVGGVADAHHPRATSRRGAGPVTNL